MENLMANRLTAGLVVFALLSGSTTRASPPDELDGAVHLSADWDEEQMGLEINFWIAPGYYLYRDSITVGLGKRRLTVLSSRGQKDAADAPREIYRHVAFANTIGETLPREGKVFVSFGGCGDDGFCYPAITRAIDLAALAGHCRETAPVHIGGR